MLKFAFCGGILLIFLTSCSLYESSGREAIEKNQNNIMPPAVFANGLDKKFDHYYTCVSARDLPVFLREPLEVIETRHEIENISVMLNTGSPPDWVAVYRYNEDLMEHESCKIYFIYSPPSKKTRVPRHYTLNQILRAANIGIHQIKSRTTTTRP